MAEDPATGLDVNDLYLDSDAALKVAGHFKTLARNLDQLTKDFFDFGADLGMNECEEGRSWNRKVNEAAKTHAESIASFSDKAADFQSKAEATHAAFIKVEEQNRKRFESGDMPNVTREVGSPPQDAGTFEI